MTRKHQHKGRYEISWEKFGSLCRELAMKIAQEFKPECVVGISKGGLPLATVLASIFRVDLYPVRLSYREMDRETHTSPEWSVLATDKVKRKKVLLVDDISVSGETLKIAREEILKMGAEGVKTVTLSVHTHSVKPDFYILETDALIIHPWDKWVMIDREFELHPEYREE
ncbi:hypothetical protein CH333_07135 [candidate division WOR-3 bacterium JGI_Cruoil_03_44_89]|uniref:Phosphoribosyltransferase domain-containing protein n=1 Tax=candidate division WOR-3 bacterium JGI_Cruoil_03_44_89 TaxID=1973748 RepID=A0A235BRI4_UNCW3|nr:MAG: hypothetical protein CH333_07135 [candidate division WOR-3 bacterium JGI_Cruoil_03_44_89]